MKLLWRILRVFGFFASGVASAQMNSVTVNDTFAFKLLAHTRKAFPGKNIFVSPIGLEFALGLVAQGAKGDTLRQMKATLQVNEAADWNERNLALLEQLSKLDAKVQLEIANSLWVQRNFPLNPAFVASSEQFYKARVAQVDFQNSGDVKIINEWVNDRTQGKIPTIVTPPLDSALRLLVLDAIYFKANWAKPFDEKLTRALPFNLASGQTKSHKAMSQTGEFSYYEDDTIQAVNLPYAGGEISMYVALPRKSLDELLPSLTLENWQRWLGQFHDRRGKLQLPKFKLENEYVLNSVLEGMGMPLAFDAAADFSGISTERLQISLVKQKTHVEVNEQGTVAAAVTSVAAGMLSVREPQPPFQMVVDRPFLIAIRENKTGTILFLGAIFDPR